MADPDPPRDPFSVRKIYFPGKGAALSLPPNWIKRHDIRAYPHVTVHDNDDGTLTIRPLPRDAYARPTHHTPA